MIEGSNTYEQIEVHEGLVELFFQDIEPSEADVCGCHVGYYERGGNCFSFSFFFVSGLPRSLWRKLEEEKIYREEGGVTGVGEVIGEKIMVLWLLIGVVVFGGRE